MVGHSVLPILFLTLFPMLFWNVIFRISFHLIFRLVKKGFLFKDGECNKVLYKVLIHQLFLEDRLETASFLLENGGSVNLRYEGGDS